jgi:hypothetical protein
MYRLIGHDGREYGPVSAETLLQWIRENRAGPQTPVRPEGETQWRVLGHLPEFAAALPGNQPPRPPSLPGPSPAPVTTGTVRTLALLSFLSGVLAWTLCCCCYGVPLNVAAVVLGAVALYLGQGQSGLMTARGWALAGLILGVLSVLLWIASLFFCPLVLALLPGAQSGRCF